MAEKSRRALGALEENLRKSVSTGTADSITFFPEHVDDQSFASEGAAGAFARPLEADGGRRISVPNCYAVQVNDDSMAPLACDPHATLSLPKYQNRQPTSPTPNCTHTGNGAYSNCECIPPLDAFKKCLAHL